MGVPIGDIKREMDIMNKLTHGRHLMGLHDAFETQTEIVLILDLYYERGKRNEFPLNEKCYF